MPAAARPHLAHWPRRLPQELVVPETTLWFNLMVTARRYPNKAACHFFGRSMSYLELHDQAEALAGWMQAQGVAKGDRVALFLQNSPQFLVAFYAAMRCAAVVVPVNPMNKADEFGHYITDPDTVLVVCGADGAAIVDQANAQLPPERRLRSLLVTAYSDMLAADIPPDLAPSAPVLAWLNTPVPDAASLSGTVPLVRWGDALAAGARPAGPPEGSVDDLALLPYTSGTTGLPKGCMHTHRSLLPNAVGGGLWSHASAETVSLAVVPMFHITGMLYGVLGPVMSGTTQVILPRWDRELAGRLISRYQVTHWTCIPTMIIDLLASPQARSFDLSSLRYLSGGGAAMPQAVAERLRDGFGLVFAEGYGLTETAAPSHANPPERAKLQCLGMPIFGVDSRVVDPDTLQEMPVGEVGEIVTRGPMLFQGYWKHPEATRAAFVEIEGKRFFRTGDLGRMDDEGYFFITDRLKRMINASGFKVWPSEVELQLYRHPAVAEACVIAARDAYRGETVKAVVVLRPEARGTVSEQDIVTWAHEQMAAYKAPRVVQFVDALPKSGSGKVMWRLLQEQEPTTAA